MLPRRDWPKAVLSVSWWPSCVGAWALVAAACGGGAGGGGAADPKLEKTSAMVSAAMGGKVAFSDGTALDVPPGALAADTMITLQRVPTAAFAKGGTAGAVELTPDGLMLSKPATLKLRYDASKVVDEGDLIVMVQSHANPLERKSGEVNPFQVIETATIDAASDTATIPVDHFSWYSVFSFPTANLALELPGKYLHNGDILYALTDGAEYNDGSATPMHVGLYIESPTNDRVIESTIPEHDCTPEFIEGVDIHTYDGVKGFRNLCGAHIFLGARQPLARVTTETRAKAVAAAESRRFKPYGIIGLNDSRAVGVVAGGISCVELIEDSWEEAGVNISLTPDIALWPHDQFWNTKPVTDIEAKVGEKIVIPLVGAFRHSKTRYTRLGASAGGSITATAFPDVFGAGRAQLTDTSTSPQGFKDLVFTPSKEDLDAGKVTFMFSMTAPDGTKAAAALTVDVYPKDDGKLCELGTYFKMIDGYFGTWTGKAGGVPFTFEDAELELNFGVNDDTLGDIDFDAADSASPRTVDVGWATIFGIGVFAKDAFRPGSSFTVSLPLQQLPGASSADSTTWWSCNLLQVREVKSGTVTIKIHDDCLGADMTVDAIGIPWKGSAGDGMTCELQGTFSGKVKPKP